MLIYAGVDGTGPDSNSVYADAFANSHVQRLYREWRTPGAAFYLRGPRDLGWSTWQRGMRAADFSRRAWNKFGGKANSEKVGIFLAGYSRGGCAAILAALELKKHKIPVHTLMLFDAVDRTGGSNADVIPDNVAYCYHAVRDPLSHSRGWFGNTGRKSMRPTKYVEKHFIGTHGAVGGCPWTRAGSTGLIEEDNGPLPNTRTRLTTADDHQVSNLVWQWANAHVMVRKTDFSSHREYLRSKTATPREASSRFGSVMIPA